MANLNKCPQCGYTGLKPSGGLCPKCGARVKSRNASPPFFVRKGFYIPFLVLLIIGGGISYLFFTSEDVATELRQIRQPMPNRFFVGIDVSATISTDTLEKLKDAVTDRLRNFIGDASVSYRILTFGNPGCAEQSLHTIVSAQSPDDPVTFGWQVEEKIREIRVTKIAPRDTTPLTTPFYHFLETVLPERSGGRVIIFSDLMNDDSDCPRQFIFPEAAIEAFGADKNGEIIFLYPTPHLTGNTELNRRTLARQQEFIDHMKTLGSQGKVRVFFHHIPDDPLERLSFIKSELKNAIPATAFDVIWERTSKVFNTIVSAVRG
ncbi:hypothetical protein DENIS_0400 [Desulfonema ishimotonii]|uniref:VWFA domain-containing protein n=1 Tax=Desulfonema ishimotonii TaxID=45657 RepID=A0A401FR74_9BACT|nr:hypothetical protein [Desulfonema ishimotonii]GBC59461.1 hypothetical protein DENIS_0400 [Desulfonema ishimotonii]